MLARGRLGEAGSPAVDRRGRPAYELQILDLFNADYTYLNERLARHYGIPGVDGWEFRRVPLPKDSHRGGVITMGSVLKVTANGTTTSPVVRGAWVLRQIIGRADGKEPSSLVRADDGKGRGQLVIEEHRA